MKNREKIEARVVEPNVIMNDACVPEEWENMNAQNKSKLIFTDEPEEENLFIEVMEMALDDNFGTHSLSEVTERDASRFTALKHKARKGLVVKKMTEFDLHMNNLQTIMRCSNATPIKFHGLWYMCCFCSKRYEDPSDLKLHTLELHHDSKQAQVGRHIAELNVRLDITDLRCTRCGVYVNDIDHLCDHLAAEHSQRLHKLVHNYIIPFKFNGKELKCVICEVDFPNTKVLLEHMNHHYPNFVCEECGASFVNRRSLQNHAHRHSNGLYKCEKCLRIFNNRIKMTTHVRYAHSGKNKRNKCDYCEERFIGVIAKSDHMIKVHGAPVPTAQCPACDKTFKNNKYLAVHIKTYHMMERRHKCSECEKMFFTTNELKQHLLTHSGRRDFQCMICSKAYGRKSTLREHMRIHADDRRFKCEQCGAAFVQKCSWKGHMRSKHGEEV